MPYKRRARRGRRRRRVVNWYNRKYSPMQLAAKAYSGMKYLKSVINVEKKVHDVTETTAVTTATITSLCQISQGDSNILRDGNSIKAVYLGLKWYLVCHPSATSCLVRFLVVKDNQQIADTIPAAGDVLNSVTLNSFLNKDTLGRFSILMDRRMHLTLNGSNRTLFGHADFPLQHHIRYNGAAAADVQKGGLYLIMMSDQPINSPTLDLRSRLRFVDN